LSTYSTTPTERRIHQIYDVVDNQPLFKEGLRE
jgi:hypothetical protein